MSGEKPEITAVVPAKRYKTKVLNPRELATAKNYIEAVKTGKKTSLRQSAIQSGYAVGYATSAAKRVSDLISTNEEIRAIMEAEGIGVKTLVRDMKKLRLAKLPPHKDGKRYEDNFIRLETTKLGFKLHDAFPTPTVNVNERKIVINLTGDDVARAKRHLTPDEIRELDA